MSNLNLRSVTGKDGLPVLFPTGIQIGAGAAGGINNIGIANQPGFGVGVCPGPLPAGMGTLFGYTDPTHDNYGNYMYSDGSIMIWRPAYWLKYGTGSNGLAVNQIDIKPFGYFGSVSTAAASGYFLPRSFWDGGAVQPGYFRDKYKVSNNGGVASSVKNGVVITSAQRGSLSTATFASLNGAPAGNYAGAIAAAKTRGANFFVASRAMKMDAAWVALAQAQAANSTTYCAWYSPTNNFPKGCNNGALGDAQDADILYLGDGNGTYNAPKTGSANLFARTTDNGQNCGFADENGGFWEVTPGLTSDGTNLYVMKTAARMMDVTGGNGLATDLWGAAGLAALYDNLGGSYGVWRATGADRLVGYGSASQVFSDASSGNAWNAAGMGIMLAEGGGGTNAFGNDGFWDYNPNEMCPISGGGWGASSGAGVWALNLSGARSDAYHSVSFRAACYL